MSDISYNNWSSMTDESMLSLLGNFVKKQRLDQNRSQSEVAKSAGISRSTISLMERGENVSLLTWIQVLRVLDALHIMEHFKVEEEISPIAYAKWKKKQRKRASSSPENNNPEDDVSW